MTAYYNEHDRNAAAWLRELIEQGLIAPGEVDERSIVDIKPSELAGYTQCHFFAGIGVWSYALRLAGWSDDTPVWTGSCPCQPFSAAGKGGGFADERHLWPAFYYLISQCRPPVVFGEQVGSKDGLTWLDLVHTDMEAANYAFGATDLCAAGFGAPHIRQRLYFVANDQSAERTSQRPQPNRKQDRLADGGGVRELGDDDDDDARLEGRRLLEANRIRISGCELPAGAAGDYGGVAHAESRGTSAGKQPRQLHGAEQVSRPSILGHPQDIKRWVPDGCEGEQIAESTGPSGTGGLEQSGGDGWNGREATAPGDIIDGQAPTGAQGEHGAGFTGAHRDSDAAIRPTNGFWRDADWIACRDNKWRAVEPGSFPLAHGAPARVGRLRGYGNAIVAEVAKEFIQTYMTR